MLLKLKRFVARCLDDYAMFFLALSVSFTLGMIVATVTIVQMVP